MSTLVKLQESLKKTNITIQPINGGYRVTDCGNWYDILTTNKSMVGKILTQKWSDHEILNQYNKELIALFLNYI